MQISKNTISEKIKNILELHNIKRASLFGSFARGDNDKNSDIDLLVEFNGKKGLFDLVTLKNDLENNLKIKFDIVTFKSINPLLKKQILSEQFVII